MTGGSAAGPWPSWGIRKGLKMNLIGKSVIAAVAMSACGVASAQDVYELNFARVGMSYSAFTGGDHFAVGRRVISARVTLRVDITAGDASAFYTDILLPTQPDDGNISGLGFSGTDLGWSGLGQFEYILETEQYNGTVIARRWGAATYGEGYEGEILEGSKIELFLEPAGCAADFNADGFVDFFDYSDFVSCFEEGACPGEATADFNNDGFVDFFDYSDYVTAFEAGC